MPRGQKTKACDRNSVVTNSMKTLKKWSTLKKNLGKNYQITCTCHNNYKYFGLYVSKPNFYLFISSQTSSDAGLVNSHSIWAVSQVKNPRIILDLCSHQLHAVTGQQVLSSLFLKNILMNSSFYHKPTGLRQHHVSSRVLQYPFLFFFLFSLAVPHSMRELSSLTRARIYASCSGRVLS